MATHHQSISDQISGIEQKLISYGSGPHSSKQQEEITKLKNSLGLLKNKLKQAGQVAGLHNRQTVPGERVLERSRLQELVREVDPLVQLEQDVEEVLLQVADDFIENVVSASCQLARHRGSKSLESTDVQLHLERNWNIWIPGYGADEPKTSRRSQSEAHKQRMALIKKHMKKT